MENRKYNMNRKMIWILPLYLLLPFGDLLDGHGLRWMLAVKTVLWWAAAVGLYLASRKAVVEVADNRLIFHSGVGLYDPSSIALKDIHAIERPGRRMLLITPLNQKAFSLEADKYVLDRLEHDLAQHLGAAAPV